MFFLRLHSATEDQHFLEIAQAGGRHLVHRWQQHQSPSEFGLYTGAAGVAFVLDELADHSGDPAFATAADEIVSQIKSSADRSWSSAADAVRWNSVTDIIGGSAGIGMLLLSRFQAKGDEESLELAIGAGDGLLSVAQSVQLSTGGSGSRWMMSPDFPRELPNYSHGTAGVADYLVALEVACRKRYLVAAPYDGRFLQAAVAGADYLRHLMNESKPGLIPHHFPNGEELFYLGWCHGPAGTMRLFESLHAATGDEQYRSDAQRLKQALAAQPIPQQRPEGFWNNVSICCGNGGVASLCVDQALRHGDAESRKLALVMIDDLLGRATEVELEGGKKGLKWIQAEHRVRPEFLQAQTGLMQGAAGNGLALLKAHALVSDGQTNFSLPPLPLLLLRDSARCSEN